eukprot:3484061-Pyramimonas_sp.AAC.1
MSLSAPPCSDMRCGASMHCAALLAPSPHTHTHRCIALFPNAIVEAMGGSRQTRSPASRPARRTWLRPTTSWPTQ